MQKKSWLKSWLLVLLVGFIICDVFFVEASTRAEKKKRPGRELRRKKERRALPPQGAFWRGTKLKADQSGILEWHVADGVRVSRVRITRLLRNSVAQVEKNALLLTIQWIEESSEGVEEEYEEKIYAPWAGKVFIRNLKHCKLSEKGKVILELT